MKEKKEYVYIQSTTSIVVTAGLQCKDETVDNPGIQNRLKVSPVWPKLKFMIKAGRHIYPALIIEWPTVKALCRDGILTIGEYTDEPNDSEFKAKVDDLKYEVEVAKKQKIIKDINLDEVAK